MLCHEVTFMFDDNYDARIQGIQRDLRTQKYEISDPNITQAMVFEGDLCALSKSDWLQK